MTAGETECNPLVFKGLKQCLIHISSIIYYHNIIYSCQYNAGEWSFVCGAHRCITSFPEMVSTDYMQTVNFEVCVCVCWWEKERGRESTRAAAQKQRAKRTTWNVGNVSGSVPVVSCLSGSVIVVFSLHSPAHQNLETQYHLLCLIEPVSFKNINT